VSETKRREMGRERVVRMRGEEEEKMREEGRGRSCCEP
jgi:hypothetical protein